MAAGSTLRFDGVPIEDFLACLDAYEKDVRTGYLPRPAFLHEAKLDGAWSPREGGFSGHLDIFFLQETDPLTQRSEAFVLFRTESSGAAALRALALRVRDALDQRRVPALFRIDPRYGLLCGSAVEPVDPLVKWSRPGCYIALYLTPDPASPSLALLDYVPAENQDRYREFFQRYNRIQPPKTGLLQTTWKRLTGMAPEVPPARRFTYTFLRQAVGLLRSEPLQSLAVSLIYKDVDQNDGRSVMLDAKYATFAPSGQDRFFASLGDLA
jgi:hypothetical protein